MPPLTREDIAKMKEELRKDLEALERVEKLFSRRNGASSSDKPVAPSSHFEMTPPPQFEESLSLKKLCITGLSVAGAIGAMPKDLLQFCKDRGYKFTSDVNGSASVSTALSRLIEGGKVRKENGRYYWIGANG